MYPSASTPTDPQFTDSSVDASSFAQLDRGKDGLRQVNHQVLSQKPDISCSDVVLRLVGKLHGKCIP